jgi:hypothetical protein
MTKYGGRAPCTRIEDARDIRVIHHGQRLPLLLEARDHLLRIHPILMIFKRHAPPHGRS